MGRGSRVVGVAALVGLLGVVVGCGGDDDDDAAADKAGTGGDSVTIEHLYGSTTIDETPKRIVSLDAQWTDVLTDLGAPLVGVGVFGEAGGEPLPWQELGEDVELVPISDGLPYEQIARLDPDLITITYGAEEQADYDQLSEIAPTIPLLSEEQVDTWQDIAATAGKALRSEDEAAQLVTDTEQWIDGLAAELPGLQGTTFAFVNYVAGDAIYVLTDPEDGANGFFSDLGLKIEPGLLAAGDDVNGRLELSLERIDMLAAEMVLMLTNGADPAEVPGYDQLPAVQAGAAQVIEMDAAFALNTPSPLSLRYVLEQIRPTLEAAAG